MKDVEHLNMRIDWSALTENEQITLHELLSKAHTAYAEMEAKDMIECYVGDYVAYTEFGKTKITTKANYEAVIRNASMILTFDGTIHEAVEYIKQNLEVH